MASDKQQLQRATRRHKTLLRSETLSRPQTEACVGILCSYDATRREVKAFRSEALSLADRYLTTGSYAVEVALNATSSDTVSMIQSPHITDIVVIGHGSLTDVDFPEGSMDWWDASIQTTHLKTGQFVQRICGHFSRRLNVPLGTFVVADQRQVIAPVKEYFQPKGLLHIDNELLQAAHSQPLNSAGFIIEQFSLPQTLAKS